MMSGTNPTALNDTVKSVNPFSFKPYDPKH